MSNIVPIANVVATMTWESITFAVINMTPTIARKMLENNTKNRSLSPVVAGAYKADKELGNWTFTGDPIRFHEDGRLIDGQHRCTAISAMDEGYSEHVLCIFGLGDEAQIAMDQGKKRSAADQLGLEDYSHTALTAATVRWMLIIEKDLLFRDTTKRTAGTTSAQIREWAASHPEAIKFIAEIHTDVKSALVSPSILAAAALIFSRIDEAQARKFVSQIRTGAGLEAGSAILAFRERATRNKLNKRKDSDRDVLGLLIKAWNAERAGKRQTKLQLPKATGGKAPTFSERNFPKPI